MEFESFNSKLIHFITEQDGVPERKLKEDLFKFFIKTPSIHKAYLVKAKYYETNEQNVVLCLETVVSLEKEKENLARKLANIFAKHFCNGVCLDFMFLTEEYKAEVDRICKPFYDTNMRV